MEESRTVITGSLCKKTKHYRNGLLDKTSLSITKEDGLDELHEFYGSVPDSYLERKVTLDTSRRTRFFGMIEEVVQNLGLEDSQDGVSAEKKRYYWQNIKKFEFGFHNIDLIY
ncbi:MAG: hypothetical protein ABIF88_03745 [archaeon]